MKKRHRKKTLSKENAIIKNIILKTTIEKNATIKKNQDYFVMTFFIGAFL